MLKKCRRILKCRSSSMFKISTHKSINNWTSLSWLWNCWFPCSATKVVARTFGNLCTQLADRTIPMSREDWDVSVRWPKWNKQTLKKVALQVNLFIVYRSSLWSFQSGIRSITDPVSLKTTHRARWPRDAPPPTVKLKNTPQRLFGDWNDEWMSSPVETKANTLDKRRFLKLAIY